MTHAEILQRLQTIKEKGTQALRLLESKPLSVDTQAEIRSLAKWIKEELHNEYNRMLPKRAQKTMSVFELSVYSPTIEETWKKSGTSRLKTDGVLTVWGVGAGVVVAACATVPESVVSTRARTNRRVSELCIGGISFSAQGALRGD